MIPYSGALAEILKRGSECRLAAETAALQDLPGRICAADIAAPCAIQPFDNSAMDGYAVIAADLETASAEKPVALENAGHLAAGGAQAERPLTRGACCEIMTGAAVPPGCDAVVPVEMTGKDAQGRVVFRAPAGAGDHIRRAGMDFAPGDAVLKRGGIIRPEGLLALATLGISRISVLARPRVGLVSTGLEVVDDMDAPLHPGQIYNATGPYLRAALGAQGTETLALGTVADAPAVFREKIEKALAAGCNLVISTGAVSAGAHDFVPAALKDMGAEVFFHKVAMRPGKPVFFAGLPNGALFLGLPGNPASTAVGFRFFARPLLRAMQGLPPEEPRFAVLSESYKKKQGLRFFLRAVLAYDEKGRTLARILSRQQSFMVSPFLASDAWAALPEEEAELQAGTAVMIYA